MPTLPADTPYMNGLFHFDITLGLSYPAAAPTVQLITTGGGAIRFNPNLYANGKVSFLWYFTCCGADSLPS